MPSWEPPGLDRHAMRAVTSIQIIIKNDNVLLEGGTATEIDKNLASISANGVSGVFSVTNNLRTEQAPRKQAAVPTRTAGHSSPNC